MWELLPSGSAGRPKTCPVRYKYYQELSFLDAILSINVNGANVKEEEAEEAADEEEEEEEEEEKKEEENRTSHSRNVRT